MSTPNPACTVNGSAPPQDATAGSTVTIALANAAGASLWFLTCIATDDTNLAASINATLVIDQVHKTATFTAPAGAGSAVIFQSTVGVSQASAQGYGRDVNGVVQPSYTTTFKVNVKCANGLRVLALNESFEQSAAFGTIVEINAGIRNSGGGGGGGSVTGTGVWISVGGVLQAAASLGTAGQGLYTNASASGVAWAGLSGDASNSTTPGQVTVVGLRGRAVAATAPTDGQVLTWSAGASQWQPATPSGLAQQSVSGGGTVTANANSMVWANVGGGTVTVNAPASVVAGTEFGVCDGVKPGAFSATAYVTMPNASGNIEDPSSPGTYTTNPITLKQPGQTVIWMADPTGTFWKIKSSA